MAGASGILSDCKTIHINQYGIRYERPLTDLYKTHYITDIFGDNAWVVCRQKTSNNLFLSHCVKIIIPAHKRKIVERYIKKYAEKQFEKVKDELL